MSNSKKQQLQTKSCLNWRSWWNDTSMFVVWFLGRGTAAKQDSREAVSFPSLEIHKGRPDETLDNLLWPHLMADPAFKQAARPTYSCSPFPTKLGLCHVSSHSKSYQPDTSQRRYSYPASFLSAWHFGPLANPFHTLFCPIRQNLTYSYLPFHSPPFLGACKLFSGTNLQASLVFLRGLSEQREQQQTPLKFISNSSDEYSAFAAIYTL